MKKGWEVKKLGEVCSLEYGKPLEKKARTENGLYPAYGANGVFTRTNKYYYDKPSIIIGRKGTAGALTLTDDKFYPLDVTYYVVFDEKYFDRKFLYYFLNTKNLPILAKGVKPGINRHDVYALPISYPSLLEQQRIVKILDTAFAKIDTIKQNAERNLQNSKELFQSLLNKIFLDLDRISHLYKMADLCTKIGSGATPKGGQKNYKLNGISLIRSMNVHNAIFKYANLAYIDQEQANLLRNVTVEENDVLINITGASIARVCIVPSDILPARVNQHVSILRIKQQYVLPSFINYLLISQPYQKKLLSIGEKGGTTRQAITKAQLENFTVFLPQLEEQHQIVTKLDGLSEKCKELENNYRQTITDCDEMKKSILAKAFNGEL